MNKPNLFFPTPVWTLQLDNYQSINEQMYKFIKITQSKDQQGISKSNIKGWHSKDFNMQENEPKDFIKFILPAIEQVITDMNWEKQKQSININNLGNILDVKQGKLFELTASSKNREQAIKEVERICADLLTNSVIEEFKYYEVSE